MRYLFLLGRVDLMRPSRLKWVSWFASPDMGDENLADRINGLAGNKVWDAFLVCEQAAVGLPLKPLLLRLTGDSVSPALSHMGHMEPGGLPTALRNLQVMPEDARAGMFHGVEDDDGLRELARVFCLDQYSGVR